MAVKKEKAEIVAWSEQLAKMAEVEAAKEVVSDIISSISLKGGIMRIGDTQIPGNRIAVIIACNVFENTFYESSYDSDNPTPPVCYAFGKTLEDMRPTEFVKEKQNDLCANCPNNEFGSALVGRGKACNNRRKLMCVPAGEFDIKTNEWLIEESADEYESVQPAILSIPPTSLTIFSKYIKDIFKKYKRPVNAVITEIKILPDDKRQFILNFNCLDVIEKNVHDVIISRVNDFDSILTKAYSYTNTEEKKLNNKKLSNKISRKR